MNFSAEELDAEVINDVLLDALPKGMDMNTLMDIEPSAIESILAGNSDNEQTSKQHRTIKWLVIVYSFCYNLYSRRTCISSLI